MTGLVLCCLGHVLVLYRRPEEAVAAHREALQLCRDYGAAEDVCRSCLIFSSDLSQCSRYDEAERLAADGIVFAVKTGHMNFYGIGIASNRIGALLKAGRWREAERVYSQFDDRVPETVTWRHGPWLYMLLGQGRVREARAIVDVLREDTADADVQFGAEMLVRAGELADLEERRDQARDLFRRGLELSRGTDDHYFTSQACASGIRVERRRIESTAGPRGAGAEIQRARQVADQLIARARDLAARFPTNGFALLPEPPHVYRPQRGEYAAVWGQDTAEIWADLADTGERVGQPYPVAVVNYREADALLRHHGDRGRARHCADAALDVAERLGAGPTEG